MDDGSTDKSRNIIDKYSGRVKKIYKKNGGQASAFNAGLEHVTGDIVLFLDSDDILYGNALSKIKENWKMGSSRCHFRLNIIDSDGQLQPGEIPKINEKLCTGDVFQWQLYGGKPEYNIVPTSGNAFCRSILKKVIPIDERYKICADAYLFFSTARFGDVIAIEENLGAYRKHELNHYASYLGAQISTKNTIRSISTQLTHIHIKTQYINQIYNKRKGWLSFWLNNISLKDARAMFVGKMISVNGPLDNINAFFSTRRIVVLIFCSILVKQNKFQHWLRALLDLVLMPLLDKNQRIIWITKGIKYLRELKFI